jgi:hypothetical protein
MRKRLLIAIVTAGLLAIFGSGQASAAVLGQGYTVRVTPPKQDNSRLAPIRSLVDTITTPYDSTFSPGGSEVVLAFSKDIRLNQGQLPACNTVLTQPAAQVRAACPKSIVGQGTAEVNNGALHSVVTVLNGPPHRLYFHFDTENGAVIAPLTAQMNPKANTLTIALPNVPGTVITQVITTINRVRTGKKTYFVEARCRKKKWVNSVHTTYLNGQSTSARSVQRCKRNASKR